MASSRNEPDDLGLRRAFLRLSVVKGRRGGISANGPFRVKKQFRRLIYCEGKHKLTLPVEPGLQRTCSIGTAYIRHWDDSAEPFSRDQSLGIARNIFAALDYLKIPYTEIYGRGISEPRLEK